MSGLATLGAYTFRINPSDVRWNFEIITNSIDTVGGRVVQIIGATLSDLTIEGFYGEDRSRSQNNNEPGRSWRLAETFVAKVREMMVEQSSDAKRMGLMHAPIRFKYPAKGWDFGVYIKSIQDQGGGSVSHTTGKFSYAYQLTLFIVDDWSGQLRRAGFSGGVIDKKREQAIASYIARISKGIGWAPSRFNDPALENALAGERPSGTYGSTGMLSGDVRSAEEAG